MQPLSFSLKLALRKLVRLIAVTLRYRYLKSKIQLRKFGIRIPKNVDRKIEACYTIVTGLNRAAF
ncbi:hypothetical protein IMSAGC018_01061 [Lachnospiraceae bacterium]|nr:hypothetical protein IMSAGC018_01061 [Lachnospiraceae bacterium]